MAGNQPERISRVRGAGQSKKLMGCIKEIYQTFRFGRSVLESIYWISSEITFASPLLVSR